jgi:hypothetical protein
MQSYLPFIDWMKCLGIFIIVIGHVAGDPFESLVPPIYTKQLGVAFFIFALGYLLTCRTHSIAYVLRRRLFDVYFWGIAFALLMSIVTFISNGAIAKSNYLPFLFGANVFFDFFPANPTTWFIGTYLHLLVLWALFLRHIKVTPMLFSAIIAIEVIVRSLLMHYIGLFVSYMFLTNWISVFVLGLWAAQRASCPKPKPVLAGAMLLLFVVSWLIFLTPIVTSDSFPFMTLYLKESSVRWQFASLAISSVYLIHTLLVYNICLSLSIPKWARFIARNSLFIFICHMPLYYALGSIALFSGLPYLIRLILLIALCLPGLGYLSDFLHRFINLNIMRNRFSALGIC